MYITTSRKPSAPTRVLARNLASFLNGIYENRGKKSIEDAVAMARRLGHNRVMVLSESKGNPNQMAFISVDSGWEWMEPTIIFSVPTAYLKERAGKIGKEVSLSSDDDEIASLFDVNEPATDDVVVMLADKSRIAFSYGSRKLELNIKHLLRKRAGTETEIE